MRDRAKITLVWMLVNVAIWCYVIYVATGVPPVETTPWCGDMPPVLGTDC